MNNTMERGEYIKENVIWSLIAFLWFKSLLFRCIPNCTYNESLMWFLIISICVVTAGIAISWRRNRNYKNLLENIVLSWGVFACITYMQLYKKWITYTLLIIGAFSLILSMIVLFRRIKRHDKRRKIMIRRIEKVAALCKRNVAAASLVIIAPILVSSIFYGSMLNSKVEATKVYGDEHSLKANIEVIADIEPSRWDKLDIQEKLDVCQKIINCEARYYGLSHEIKVGIADLEEGTWGYYNDSNHQVIIDVQYLENSYSYHVLQTLLHECTHAYQHEQVALYQKLDEKERNLLMYYDVAIYAEEFASYEDGDEDFDAYYMQLSEMHARRAGETDSLEYIKAINEYLGIQLDVEMEKFDCLDDYIEYISME